MEGMVRVRGVGEWGGGRVRERGGGDGVGGAKQHNKKHTTENQGSNEYEDVGVGWCCGLLATFSRQQRESEPQCERESMTYTVHTELAKGGLVLKLKVCILLKAAAKDLAGGRVCIWPEAACASGQRPP
jgi:hypothetical protein